MLETKRPKQDASCDGRLMLGMVSCVPLAPIGTKRAWTEQLQQGGLLFELRSERVENSFSS